MNSDTKISISRLEASLKFLREHETKVRFLLAGALNTTVGLAAYPIFFFTLESFKLHYLTILMVSQIFCISFSFLTSKHLVFRTSGGYLRESLKFATFHLSYLLVNLAALPALVEVAGMKPVWAQTLFAILIIITSYFWHSRITFNKKKEVQ
jgi:putative flippase GtrA